MLRAISLYTGIGGLDFGFEAAGIRTAVAVEMDSTACAAIRANRKWPLLEGDINEISSDDILSKGGLRPGQADVLIGGPPCQPFSKSGYWVNGDARRLDDPRSDTLAAYLRVLRDAKPRAFLLENVHGIAFKGKEEGLNFLLRGIEGVNRFAGTGYRVAVAKLNAADYGVPQTRERVFLIGSRDGTVFNFPVPTHGASQQDLIDSELLPYKTAWDAIGDLPQAADDPALQVGGRWGDLLPSIPEGENYLWHTERGGGEEIFGWRRRYWSFLLKLAKNRPSWTIQAQPGTATGPFHWCNRRLTAQELCRLQTFPDGLTFDCNQYGVQKLLGNAVPSLLAEVLAREIRSQLLGSKPRQKALKLLPAARGPAPAPERRKPVPEKYRPLIGKHDAHPGEGKGTRAQNRAQVALSLEQSA